MARDLMRRLQVLTENVDPDLVEDDADQNVLGAPPRVLDECFAAEMPYYESYHERSLEDRLRQAVGMIHDAVRNEAWKGIGDDGKVMKPVDYRAGEKGVWEQVDELLSKAVFVNQFKPLVEQIKAIIAANQV